mgnify:CR=1 FL=1
MAPEDFLNLIDKAGVAIFLFVVLSIILTTVQNISIAGPYSNVMALLTDVFLFVSDPTVAILFAAIGFCLYLMSGSDF